MPKRVVFVSNGYPTKDNPTYAFLAPVVRGLAKSGIKCTVIAPQSINKAIRNKTKVRPFHWVEEIDNNQIDIFQPKYLSVPKLRFRGYKYSAYSCIKAIKRAYRRVGEKPDCFYAHFWDSAINASAILDTDSIPIIVACGEEKIWAKDLYPNKVFESALKKIKGVICVSTANYKKCEEEGYLKNNPCSEIIVNAYDSSVFYHIDKKYARSELGISKDEKIVAFVGTFNERKGIKRLIEAVKPLPEVKLILIGRGERVEEDERIVFCGSLPHDKINLYLNAADVFVLPTLSEGCCNAIVEAIGCGLPIISSDRDFNDDILNSQYSIRINPEDIGMIRDAIKRVLSDEDLLNRMSWNSIERAKDLTLEKRIERIIEFMERVAEQRSQ